MGRAQSEDRDPQALKQERSGRATDGRRGCLIVVDDKTLLLFCLTASVGEGAREGGEARGPDARSPLLRDRDMAQRL